VIEFDEKRKLFTVSRRLVVVYSKVVYMGRNEILGPVNQVELEPSLLLAEVCRIAIYAPQIN
jgi:hypothetical protein